MRGYAIDAGADRIVGKAPCLNCTDRHVGCQGKCEDKYLPWKRARDAFRAEAMERSNREHEADIVHHEGVQKALKKRGVKIGENK